MDLEPEPGDEEEAIEVKLPSKQPIAPRMPRTAVVRRRNILRTDHLISARGIAALPEIFSQTKFKGKGHERDDLRLMLFKTKHWAHRLFPALTFEDFVAKTEQLGHKKVVKNFLTRIRRGQPLDLDRDRDVVHSDDEDGEQPPPPKVEPTESEAVFDSLFKDHIDQMNNARIANVDNDDDVGGLLDDLSDDELLVATTEKSNNDGGQKNDND